MYFHQYGNTQRHKSGKQTPETLAGCLSCYTGFTMLTRDIQQVSGDIKTSCLKTEMRELGSVLSSQSVVDPSE